MYEETRGTSRELTRSILREHQKSISSTIFSTNQKCRFSAANPSILTSQPIGKEKKAEILLSKPIKLQDFPPFLT